MLSIYYEYCKNDITAILFMLDFTCKLMEDMNPEDTLGKSTSKIKNSNRGFAEGGFHWCFCWLVGWVFSRKDTTKISRR